MSVVWLAPEALIGMLREWFGLVFDPGQESILQRRAELLADTPADGEQLGS